MEIEKPSKVICLGKALETVSTKTTVDEEMKRIEPRSS